MRWLDGEKRGVSTRLSPLVSARMLAPSWSMMASRLMRLSLVPLSETKTMRVSK